MNEESDVVISGMSGRFPASDNITELMENLLKGVDLVAEKHNRWPNNFYGLNDRGGILKSIDSFDGQFFGISPRQISGADPRTRILMEVIFEAIIDAGVNPTDMRGSKTGVFVGMTPSNTVGSVFDTRLLLSRLVRSTAMASGLIAFVYDFHGPNYSIDTACSSSMYAFCQAVQAIRAGECDAAIVCGATIILDPFDAIEYDRMNILSPTGKCKTFDVDRDGFVKSESIVATFLQKSKDANRIYAHVVGSGTNSDGFKTDGVANPSTQMQVQLLKDIYSKYKIDPLDVNYIEAHGTGTQVGDVNETNAIAEFLCKDRKEPLLIGSVKTNIGHTEMSAGLTSIIKVLLQMEYERIPGILHLNQVGEEFTAIVDGRLKVVTENMDCNGGLSAVNCFGIGGTNAHVVLKPFSKSIKPSLNNPKYRLVFVGGRTEKGVQKMLDFVENNADNPYTLALLDNIFHRPVQKYYYKGYCVLGNKNIKSFKKVEKTTKPIWFIFSGIGSQWVNMAKDLMQFDLFRHSMNQCAQIAKSYHIDLIDILMNGKEHILEDPVNSFLTIVVMSICFVDVLKQLDINPDGYIGHSVGEIGCAYADGCVDKEQAILMAVTRGDVLKRFTKNINGGLAVVGLSETELLLLLPKTLSIACYNSSDNLTISGPRSDIEKFIEDLKTRNIFAEVIQEAKYPYHSPYIQEAAEKYREALTYALIPKERSFKWISSSVPKDQWKTDLGKYNSPEYQFNNFFKPVLFGSALEEIPKNAVIIEISPKGLFQTLLRKNVGKETISIDISSDRVPDNFEYFLSGLGRIYMAGPVPNIQKLYESKQCLPVPRGTPTITNLIDWDHSQKYNIQYYSPLDTLGEKFVIDLMDANFKFLEGHKVEGKVILPVVGYLYLVWELLAKIQKKPLSEVPIVVDTLKIRRMTILPKEGNVVLVVQITLSSGAFEIHESEAVVAEGRAYVPTPVQKQFTNIPDNLIPPENYIPYTHEDIYYRLRRIGFMYENHFRGLMESNIEGTKGKIQWNGHWIAFLDAMLHYTAIGEDSKYLALPESIDKVIIDPRKHLTMLEENENILPISIDQYAGVIRSGFVEYRDLKTVQLPQRKPYTHPLLEKSEFTPYFDDKKISLRNAVSFAFQIVQENFAGVPLIKILQLDEEPREDIEIVNEINSECSDESKEEAMDSILTNTIKRVLKEEGLSKMSYETQTSLKKINLENHGLLILERSLTTDEIQSINNKPKLFLLVKEENPALTNLNYEAVSKFNSDYATFVLLKQKVKICKNSKIVKISTKTFAWVTELQEIFKQISEAEPENKFNIYIVSQDEPTSGIIGLFNCLKFEEGGGSFVRAYFITDSHKKFDLMSDFYKSQLNKDLAVNVLRNGTWGSYRFSLYEKILEVDTEFAHATTSSYGDFGQIKFKESTQYRNQEGLVDVYYTGLNFKDVLIANGTLRIPGKSDNNFELGLEYSGKLEGGTRIMGLTTGNGIATKLQAFPYFSWPVPETWTLEEAASVPVIYCTLYYAFFVSAKLEKNDSILIHCGAGGIGMASIQIALDHGCDVFVTPENIGQSRDASFEIMVRRATRGKGVNVVVNSLIGDLLDASMRCIAVSGRFIEIGKIEFITQTTIKSAMFLKNVSLHAISLDTILSLDTFEHQGSLHHLIKDGLSQNKIKPIPKRTVFDCSDIPSAFRFHSTGTHMGKVLIKMRNEGEKTKIVRALATRYFNPEQTFIIIGGLGGLGIELAVWLNWKTGVQKIVLNGRRPVTNGYQGGIIRLLRLWGCQVIINTDDTSVYQNAEKLIAEAEALGPVGGIFNLAMVLRDDLLENQTVEKFQEVFKAKVLTTQNLDAVSRKSCPDLEHFVTYSSISCGKGNLGQTNYGFANSTMERICEQRINDNLPGMVIQWGPIADVGYFARANVKLDFGSLSAQPIESYINVLEQFMLNTKGIFSSTVFGDATQALSKMDSLYDSVMMLFGIVDASTIDDNTTLLELGMDSLMGFEIKQYLFREYEIDILVKDLRNLTLAKIKEIDIRRKKGELKIKEI